MGGKVFFTKMKIARSAGSLTRFRMTYTNWPTLRSAGTRYLYAHTAEVSLVLRNRLKIAPARVQEGALFLVDLWNITTRRLLHDYLQTAYTFDWAASHSVQHKYLANAAEFIPGCGLRTSRECVVPLPCALLQKHATRQSQHPRTTTYRSQYYAPRVCSSLKLFPEGCDIWPDSRVRLTVMHNDLATRVENTRYNLVFTIHTISSIFDLHERFLAPCADTSILVI